MKNSNPSDNAKPDGFAKICSVSSLKENSGKRFLINDIDIAVFKIDGTVYAVGNICPHQHTALIYDGFIENGCVVCPAHGWTFDLKTGKKLSGRKGLDTYPVKTIDDNVYIKVQDSELNWKL